MKRYMLIGGMMHVGDAPDGAMYLKIGLVDNEGSTITAIDYKAKVYTKAYGDWRKPDRSVVLPFPERWWTDDSLSWTPYSRPA